MTNSEAISIITQIKGIITNDNSWSDVAKVAVKEAFDLAIKALEERPQGRWLETNELIGTHLHSVLICSVCGARAVDKLNFCPDCGAYLRKEE